MEFVIKLSGIEGYSKKVRNLAKEPPRAALRKGAFTILKTTRPLTPRKTGALVGSGQVLPVEQLGRGRFGATVQFGGQSIPYTVRQHENMSYAHPNGGQAKFLTVGAQRARAQVRADFLADIAALWKAAAK